MIKKETERMIMHIEYDIVNKKIEFPKSNNEKVNLLKLKKAPGIYFFEKGNISNLIVKMSFKKSDDKLEISYGIPNVQNRNKGYMKEALKFFINWLFLETDEKELNARIYDNDVSQHILEITGFFENGKTQDGSLLFTLTKN